MTEILRFEMNVPVEVALKHPGPGRPIEGRYGNRVMYTLADERVMYVAPIVASRITDLGIQPGERFHVRKQLKRQGSRRLIEWDVQRVVAEPETELERELRESIAVALNAKAAPPPEKSEVSIEPGEGLAQNVNSKESDPQPPPQEQIARANARSSPTLVSPSTEPCEGMPQNGNSNAETKLEDTVKPANSGDHATAEVRAAQQCIVPPVPAPTPAAVPVANGSANGSQSSTPKNGNNPPLITTKLEHALKTAISAAYNAEKYSAELGYVVRFSADAIKSMAITVLINMSEGNRR